MGNMFADPDVRPEPEAIRAALGDASSVWEAVNDTFASAGAEVTWRYYRDGGWLAKASFKSKTLAWMVVHRGVLHVSFHFAARLRTELLHDDKLAGHLRERITQAPVSGKLFSIPLDVRAPSDVADVEGLLALKFSTR